MNLGGLICISGFSRAGSVPIVITFPDLNLMSNLGTLAAWIRSLNFSPASTAPSLLSSPSHDIMSEMTF